MWNWIVFSFLSLFLIYVSRNSLRARRSHGFYRFFAWEFMLALFLLNVEFWFQNPFVWYQLIAWTLLIASLIPLGYGIHFLWTQGKPAKKRESDPSLLAFEKTTELVTNGIYKYIRHPLYCSLLLLTWGIFFKNPTVTGTTLAVIASVLLLFTAKADETECVRFFGAAYTDYMQKSKMFIPFVF